MLKQAESGTTSLLDSLKPHNVKSRIEEWMNLDVVANWVSNDLLRELMDLKERIVEYKKQWKTVVVVNACWDLFHPGHATYLEVIEKKISSFYWLKREEFVLIVWVEDDVRIKKRKWEKRPIIPAAARKYMIMNQKQVNDSFIYPDLKEDRRPSDLAFYYKPDVFILHEEHIDTGIKAEKVRRKLKAWWIKFTLVRFKDKKKHWIYDWNWEWWITTSAIVKKIKAL